MRLSELISYVRAIHRSPGVGERLDHGGPVVDEPDAPRRYRPPFPPWVPEELRSRDRGDLVPLGDRGNLVLDLERTVSLNNLPTDVRQPNVPIDTLAYYLPFHHYERNWGIYLRESGVLRVALILKNSPLRPGDSALINTSGREILLKHEHFHFQAEVACARAEVVARLRLYDAYFKNPFAGAHEEALANASAYRGLRREPAVIRNRVSTWMKHQGPGYQDFDRWVDSAKFRAGCRRAGQYILRTIPGTWPSQPKPAEFLFDSIGRFKPPTHVVLDVSLVTVLKPFPKAHGMRVLVHARDHPPPHIHIEMPPGKPHTRYLWPQLKPLTGDPALSSRELKAFAQYLAVHRPQIDAKVRAVYPAAAAGVPVAGSGRSSRRAPVRPGRSRVR